MKLTEEYIEYLKDESRLVGKAESISFPQNEDDVKSTLRNMYEQSIPVTIQGARTGISAGAVPSGGHIMNLSKMDRVLKIDYRHGHFYLTVEAGVILSKLRESIAKRKFSIEAFDESSQEHYYNFCKDEEQFFPPDPTEASATIGGMVACNASGARSFLYGSTREYINGLRVVLSNGESLNLKRGQGSVKEGRVTLRTEEGSLLDIQLPDYEVPRTKNTSGYFVKENMDIIDLFIGSDGTLGVVTSIELKLLPLPKSIWGMTLFFEDRSKAVSFVGDVRETVTSISSIEYFDREALTILSKQREKNVSFSKIPAFKDSSAAIYLELHCQSEEEALERLSLIEETLLRHDGNSQDTWVARNDHDRDLLYFFRHAIPESVNMLVDIFRKEHPSITKLGTDMAVPNEALEEMMDIYYSMLEEVGLYSATWGHIGDNHVHVNILPRNEEEYQVGKKLYKEWAKIVVAYNGAISAEHGVGKLKTDFLKLMFGDLSEMKHVKTCLDNKAILGRGTLFDFEEVN